MITPRPFGSLSNGQAVTCYRLPGGPGAYVDVLDYGATVQAIVAPDRDGTPTDVVLGYDTAAEYEQGTLYLGATVGRHANRIGGGRFTLNGKTYFLAKNDGPNHLHGGPEGFHRRMFTAEVHGDALTLRLVSPDGDQGYPGRLALTATYTFSSENVLTIRFQATTDQDTVVNLTNHSYFDLSGGRAPMGQLLRLNADHFCENDENTLPTGKVLAAAGTPFDFTTEKPVCRDLAAEHEQLLRCGGYDHNYVLRGGGAVASAAYLRSPETGISVELSTDLPGLQFYSGNFIQGTGKGGRACHPHDAVCLEPQFFPNAMALEDFEKPVLRAGETFDRTIIYAFRSR